MRRQRWAGAAAVALVLGAGVVGLFLAFHDGTTRRADQAIVHLGTVTLAYPPAYARFAPGRSGGIFDRVEMAFTVPDLKPAGTSTAPLKADNSIEPGERQSVFMTLRPEDEASDPADRMETLYARFLQSDVWQGENGLLMRRFEAGSPYEREELHFVPPDGRSFAARCVRPTQPPSDLPSTCLATMRLDGLDIDIRFSPTLLSRWNVLSDGVRRLVDSFVQR